MKKTVLSIWNGFSAAGKNHGLYFAVYAEITGAILRPAYENSSRQAWSWNPEQYPALHVRREPRTTLACKRAARLQREN